MRVRLAMKAATPRRYAQRRSKGLNPVRFAVVIMRRGSPNRPCRPGVLRTGSVETTRFAFRHPDKQARGRASTPESADKANTKER